MKKEVAKKIIKAILFLITCATLAACAGGVNLKDYPNITINDNKKVETIQFIHPQSSPIETIKACIIENVENKDIHFKHSVNLLIYGTLFMFLVPDKNDTIVGGDVILSEKDGVVQAFGNVDLEGIFNSRNFLMFLLTAKNVPNGGTELLFSKPSIVLEKAGPGRNDGPIPLPIHYLPLFEINYRALENISNRIGICLNRI